MLNDSVNIHKTLLDAYIAGVGDFLCLNGICKSFEAARETVTIEHDKESGIYAVDVDKLYYFMSNGKNHCIGLSIAYSLIPDSQLTEVFTVDGWRLLVVLQPEEDDSGPSAPQYFTITSLTGIQEIINAIGVDRVDISAMQNLLSKFNTLLH